MTEPNDAQREIIETTDGIVCVDAGAGTGKTFAITRRYANIVDQPAVTPDDVLLATFTNNAATEMKERVVARSTYGMRSLRDAPIQTFHSLCHDILTAHGFGAPTLLGIDDGITDSTQIIENDLVEAELFREFFDRFADDHPEHADIIRAVPAPTELLGLITKLSAKGVFPTAEGWYRNGESYLDGDLEAFRDAFDERNQPRNDGRKQSRLRSNLVRYGRDRCHLPDAPERATVRGEGTKAVPEAVAERAFTEDRSEVKAFVHDVYFEYLRFALQRNYFNFGFLQLFAFVLLCEDHELREELTFQYVMIDEFQDSSEIQFKLALLLAGTNNLCVVGDWKQSIFSFQDAAIENITAFESRLDRFAAELNDDYDRVSFHRRPIEEIELTENYRSTQSILDFAEDGLLVPAASTDPIDPASVQERIVALQSNREPDNSQIEAIQHAEEAEAVLTKIQDIIENDEYAVADGDDLRPPDFGDIAVLTRTRDFGRELLHAAEQASLPLAYDGGIELFRTDQAKLVLAWLRILEADTDRGWAVVLEQAGYTLDEIDHRLSREQYPEDMLSFKAELTRLASIGGRVQRILARYGYNGQYGDVLLETIEAVHDATTMTRGDLIRFIEHSIETGSTQEVHANAGANAVTVQTIHAAKGLEHPIVILANMNRYAFPPSGGTRGTLTFDEPIGLRQRTIYDDAHGHPHLYDNWRMEVLQACLPDNWDEERRLLYVAMTRAESHLVFSAGERPNTFIEELPVAIQEIEPDVRPGAPGPTVQATFQPTISPPEGPLALTPHDLMENGSEVAPTGRGTEFGSRVHEFAEAYAKKRRPDVGGDEPDWTHIRAFIDGLPGELKTEQQAVFPLEIDDQKIAITGVVDLVHLRPDRVEVIDFKTDQTRHAEADYRIQLSVYYHVLDAWYPDRVVSALIFYTYRDETVEVNPLTKAELAQLVREHRRQDSTAGDGDR